MSAFEVTSPAFDDGAPIPDKHTYTDEDVNPPFEIGGVPEGTETLALVMDDPDAVEPAGKVWDHWVVWNIPADQTTIPEDWSADTAREGRNDYRDRGYGGPNPPDGQHTYRIRLYALDTALELEPGATKADLEAAIDGHVLAEATLEGTYAP